MNPNRPSRLGETNPFKWPAQYRTYYTIGSRVDGRLPKFANEQEIADELGTTRQNICYPAYACAVNDQGSTPPEAEADHEGCAEYADGDQGSSNKIEGQYTERDEDSKSAQNRRSQGGWWATGRQGN